MRAGGDAARALPLEAAVPASDGPAFRRALGQFATGVAIVSARRGAESFAMTINSFSALSLDPPLVLWSIRKESAKRAMFEEAGCFAINVLSSAQQQHSAFYAKAGVQGLPLGDWHAGVDGSPLLSGAVAHFQCQLQQTAPAGDHTMLIGRVLHCERFAGEPLVFVQGRYAQAAQPAAAA